MEQLTFKALQPDDLPFLNAVRNDCAEMFLHNSQTFTLEETQEWFRTLSLPYFIVRYDQTRIGYFRLSDYSDRKIYLGMDLEKKFRGKGLAYASYKLFIPYVFKTFDVDRICLEVLATNTVAIRLYQKLGFTVDEVKEKAVTKQGIPVDSIVMSLPRP